MRQMGLPTMFINYYEDVEEDSSDFSRPPSSHTPHPRTQSPGVRGRRGRRRDERDREGRQEGEEEKEEGWREDMLPEDDEVLEELILSTIEATASQKDPKPAPADPWAEHRSRTHLLAQQQCYGGPEYGIDWEEVKSGRAAGMPGIWTEVRDKPLEWEGLDREEEEEQAAGIEDGSNQEDMSEAAGMPGAWVGGN